MFNTEKAKENCIQNQFNYHKRYFSFIFLIFALFAVIDFTEVKKNDNGIK